MKKNKEKSLCSRGFKEAWRQINRLVSLGKRVVAQTRKVLTGNSSEKRIYSLHEVEVDVINRGKSFPE